jgi:ABC-type transport system involved in multi-copper enzyme maturation permease subunit
MTAVTVGARRRDDRTAGRGLGGVLVAYRGELFKLLAERRTWLGIATAAIGPIIYLLLELAQGPPGAPLADNLGHTGVGFSLVVFKLIAVFGPAVIASLVAGDIVAAEISDGTLKTALTRSITRAQLLLGKLLALYTYLLLAMAVFFLVCTIGGIVAWGFHPLVNISGQRISALHALGLDIPALLVYCMPVIAIASFGFFLSVVTGQSVAAVGGTVIYAMSLQGVAAISSIKGAHPYLLTNQLTAWHDLFTTPTGGTLILRSAWVSAAFALPPVLAALYVFHRRDVT